MEDRILDEKLRPIRPQAWSTEVFFNKASSAYKVCARGEDPSCAASVVVASGVDDHASYMGESFAAKHLECALTPSSPKALEAAAKALAA